MTKLLQKAKEEVSHLPQEEQDSIAQLVMDEIADEETWRAKFSNDSSKLESLAKEALKEYRTGKTKPLSL